VSARESVDKPPQTLTLVMRDAHDPKDLACGLCNPRAGPDEVPLVISSRVGVLRLQNHADGLERRVEELSIGALVEPPRELFVDRCVRRDVAASRHLDDELTLNRRQIPVGPCDRDE